MMGRGAHAAGTACATGAEAEGRGAHAAGTGTAEGACSCGAWDVHPAGTVALGPVAAGAPEKRGGACDGAGA